MKIEFVIEEKDYLTNQLFTITNSGELQKQERTRKFFFVGIFVLLGALMITGESLFLIVFGVFFIVFSILIILYYSIYFRRDIKRIYLKKIQEDYPEVFGSKVSIEVRSDDFHIKDKTGEYFVNLSLVEVIYEIEEYFFIKLSTGSNLIFPKRVLSNKLTEQQLKAKFNTLNLFIEERLNWNF
jgi:hypothetical protein